MDFLKDLSIDKVRNIAEDAINQVKPKTDVEARVYEVLSHKNWGASSSLMNEVARDTYDYERFVVVTQLMWESMENQRPAAWRVVFKGLTLLEHLVKNGSERCVDDARNHGHILRALGQFNYYEGTIDRGLGVREKSKQLLDILSDDDRIREERQRARKLREKFGGKSMTASSGGGGGGGQYAGYGNQDSFDRGGGSSSGYGEGGIDSNNGGYSGRYGNEGRATSSATPTFAAMPSEGKKKKKKKKPKSPTAQPPAPAPAVDLFSFDDPAPAPAPAAGNDDFGAFAASSAANSNDNFAAFQSAPAPAPSNNDSFGAFQTTPAPAPANFNNNNNASFDAFGNMQSAAPPQQQQQQQSFGAFGNNSGGNMAAMNNNNMSQMNNAFGNMNNQAQPPASAAAADDDDFGDFADAAPKTTPAPAANNDPMSKLISLDGLSKNAPKKQPNSNQSFVSQQGQPGQQQANEQPMTFAAQPVTAGGKDAISSLFAPAPPQPQANANNQGNMQGGMNPQMMQQQGGMNNPQMMQQQGMQGGMNNMGYQGNNMMGNQGMGMQGNMNMMNNQGMGMQGMHGNNMNSMNNQGMGMQGNMMGGMQGNMNGQQGMQNQMGGQQQWR